MNIYRSFAHTSLERNLFAFALFSLLVFIAPNLVLAQTGTQPHDQTLIKPLDTGPIPLFDLTPTGNSGSVASQALDVDPNPMNWTKYVYQSYQNGNWDLFTNTANMMYDPPVRVTSNPAADARPNLNPRADRIAFNSDRNGDVEIYVMNFDGSGVEQITSAPGADYAPTWSPNSTSLAFVSERDGNPEIYKIDLVSRVSQRLTADSDSDVFPTWSPDGSQIAWVKYDGSVGTIWVMDHDGSNSHPIFSGYYLQHPAWSPDGKRIAFDADIDGDIMNEIASIRLDGNDLQSIYDMGSIYHEVWMGNWTSDGTWIIYTQIWYGIVNGEIDEVVTDIVQIRLSDSYRFYSVSDGVSMLPDWELADGDRPVSSIYPLPEYSRAAKFTVNWSGIDFGPSGLFGYDIQTRTGANASWVDWLTGTENPSGQLSGTPGDTVYFRSRAIDNAANYENWPVSPNGDTFTTLFTWMFSGKAIDNRSKPAPHIPVNLTPASIETVTTDHTGHFAAHLTASGTYTGTISQTGYSVLDPVVAAIDSDVLYDFVSRPPDDLLTNGGFESDPELTGWVAGGSNPPEIVTDTLHAGYSGVMFGSDCQEPCMAEPETVAQQTPVYLIQPRFAVDQAKNVHVLWSDILNIYYSYRPAAGSWSAPVRLGGTGGVASTLDIAVDELGNVHAIWNSDKIIYAEKPVSQGWKSPVELGLGMYPKIAIDKQNNVFLLYGTSDGFYYRKMMSGGSWEARVYVGSGYAWIEPAIAVGTDNTVYFAWSDLGRNIFFRSLSPNGSFSSINTIATDGPVYRSFIKSDPNGNIFLLWNSNDNITDVSRLAMRSSTGVWSQPSSGPVTRLADIAFDRNGSLNLLGVDRQNPNQCGYFIRGVNGTWKLLTSLDTEFSCVPSLAFDKDDYLHLLLPNYPYITYRAPMFSGSVEQAVLDQVVTIPISTHQATLSWMYELISHGSTTSLFDVNVSDSSGTTRVFSSDKDADWTHGWADLSAWTGQTVTVTFGLAQAANEPPVKVYLDDVSLGSWLTPVIDQVNPTNVGSWSSAYITLSGENFIQTPSVKLDEFPAVEVEWLDDNHIRFQLPAGFQPGLYNITVTNPGGQQAMLAGGFQFGYLSYTPVILNR